MRTQLFLMIVASLVAACAPRGFSPPPSDEEALTSKNRPTVTEVRQGLNECGDLQTKHEGESKKNADARVIECMFKIGFYFKSGWGGPCSDPSYRTNLPACANAPIRSRNNYYGQPPSDHEQRKLDQDMANAIKKYMAEEARYVSLSFGDESVRFQNPAKLSNERTQFDSSDCNAYQKAVQSSGPSLLQKEKYQSVECMLVKGYPLENVKDLCKLSGWREQISVCSPYAAAYAEDQKRVYDTFKTESWPYISFMFKNPQKHAMHRVREDTDQCWSEATANFPKEWTARRIRAIECMQAKGYQWALEQSSVSCRNDDYRNSSICLGHPGF